MVAGVAARCYWSHIQEVSVNLSTPGRRACVRTPPIGAQIGNIIAHPARRPETAVSGFNGLARSSAVAVTFQRRRPVELWHHDCAL